MSGEFHLGRSGYNLQWAILLLLALLSSPLAAQWTFLGDPLISDGSVSSQSMALSPQWNPYLAYTSGGAVMVKWFDGNEWENLGTSGLPTNGVNDCALAFLPDGTACLALAPQLSTFSFDGTSWHLLPGLAVLPNMQGLQLRVAADGKLWLAGFQAGATDTTLLFSKSLTGNWLSEGGLPGRIRDLELDDVGEPLVLLASATAILHRVNGIWQNLTPFDDPDQDYVGFQMLYDGSGTGTLVIRRDTSNGLTVQQLSFGVWTQLGTAGFATGDIAELGLSHAGTAHVVSIDHANGGPPRAYEFVAGNWQFLGGQAVYNNTVSQPQWAFDPTAAYLVFRDDEEDLRNSVMYLGAPNAIPTTETKATLQFWPNPTADYLHFDLPSTTTRFKTQINDIAGRTFYPDTRMRSGLIELNVQHLPAGAYFLTVIRPNQPAIHGVFFKQ